MKRLNCVALSGLVLAGVATPGVAHAQSGATLPRGLEVAGRGAYIGVTVRDADASSPNAGVFIEDVVQDSPAEKAGMKAGDVITEFDGERVRSSLQFTRLVRETPEGRSVQAALSRAGQRIPVTVTPERSTFGDDFGMRLLNGPRARLAAPAAPAPPPPPPAWAPFEFFGRARGTGRLGVTVEDLDTQLADYFGVKEGVLVKSVAEGSAAAKAGLKAGDVITAINGKHIYDASDAARALDRVEGNGEVTVEVTRERKTQTLKGKLEARETRVRARGTA